MLETWHLYFLLAEIQRYSYGALRCILVKATSLELWVKIVSNPSLQEGVVLAPLTKTVARPLLKGILFET